MPLPAFMQKGLSALLNVVKLTDPVSINKAVSTIEQHFNFSAYEIAQAYQKSYESALNAICAGLAKPSFLDSKVLDEFADQIFPYYVLPFATELEVQGDKALQTFCDKTRKKCRALVQYKTQLFQGEDTLLTEADLAALVSDSGSLSITELVIEELYLLEPAQSDLDDQLVGFLRYNDLLGTAILFFLHELLRQEPRVETTLSYLQRQGLWQDVRNIKDTLRKLMNRLELSDQVKPRDELTQHNSESLKLIQEAVTKLKTLPTNNPQYSQLIMMGGSVLSSTGAIKEAERLFIHAQEIAENNADRALATFNLFQVHVRNQDFEQALTCLQAAIQLEPRRFALHDVEKYPIERILGAGGMGCVFLCYHKLQKRRVVVKCFWEHHKTGAAEEVFKEAFAMSDIAGEYVPAPLDYGYVDSINQERAFFVTEYVDDAIDGESWLKQYGKMDLATGLQVGLQIAEGLHIAHTAGVLHLDLKPANILLLKKAADVFETSEVSVKIIDFGLSQVATPLQQQQISSQTQAHLSRFGQAVFGTQNYAAPEQQGEEQYGKPSAKSDVFAFGKTLYRLFSGKQPRHNLRQRDLPDGPKLYELLEDCVEEEPNDRPESAQELIARLKDIQADRAFQASEKPLEQSNEEKTDIADKPSEDSDAEQANLRGDQYYNEKDFSQAVSWYRKAAEQGYALGQYNLGRMYRQGKGIELDESQAAQWYRQAAEQGDAWAQHNLGWLYKTGKGVKQDDTQAVDWFRKAAEQGHALGQSNLGFMYKIGKGVERDNRQAAHWFRKAAEQGNDWGQYNLGSMYQWGNGVEKDDSQAVDWYRQAAEQGHADSQHSLGMMYDKGKGVKQNAYQAAHWYQKAAEQGHANAQNSLGWLYQNGKGVDKDLAQALSWYRKAAEQDHVWAQNSLGWLYEKGRGVDPNEKEAIDWYRKAAAQGHTNAKKALDRLSKTVSNANDNDPF